MATNRLFPLSVAAWVCVVLWAGVIFYFSTLSGSEVEKLLPMKIWDKALHFSIFAVGAFLVAAAIRFTTGWGWRVILPVALVVVSLYGASDEWHQKFTPGRSAMDVGDWTADSLGGLAGAFVCCTISLRKQRGKLVPAPVVSKG